MLREFRADLHIHTCLSPCGDLGMSPIAIVRQALGIGLQIIAVCDHNTVENAAAVGRAAKGSGLTVLPGMEICTSEEVHIAAIFGDMTEASMMQTVVYEHLEGENDEDAFGKQQVVDENGLVLGFNRRLLIGATKLSIEETVESIHSHNGLAVAAHIDREGFGIIGQLGFIPEELKLNALELSPRIAPEEAKSRFARYDKYPFICTSDAHYLTDVGTGMTTFNLEQPSFSELRMALGGEAGRSIAALIRRGHR